MEEAIIHVIRQEQEESGSVTLTPQELCDLIINAFPHLKAGHIAQLVRDMNAEGKLKLPYAEAGVEGQMGLRVP